ncbi:MAG: DUF1850 domain-containing protein [Afipia sp.]|nr:DUF1850 domain-containing protein [Afipia sp.]OJW65193.1 MAG: hypothetical protein BGO65_14365 [Afipia sp. 64-13]
MSLCLASAGVVKSLSVAAFMLAWTHSIEKIEWQEDWRVTSQGLEIVEARVKGSGAGMEPPPEARLSDGWFHWQPKLAPLPQVALGNSGLAGEWRICADGACRTLSDLLGHPVGTNVTVMRACDLPATERLRTGETTSNERAARDADFYDRRGREHALAKAYDEAIADYNEAIRLQPLAAHFYLDRGMAYRAKGDRPRALADFTHAVRLDPALEIALAQRKALALEIEQLGARMPRSQKSATK